MYDVPHSISLNRKLLVEIKYLFFISPFLSLFFICNKVSNVKHVPFVFTRIKTVDIEKVDGRETEFVKIFSSAVTTAVLVDPRVRLS